MDEKLEAKEKKEIFSYWRTRTFYSIFFGYVFYYFTRKSFTFAMPVLAQDLDLSKSDLGLMVTVFSVSYGFSKFFSGMLGDRTNPRYFMGFGLIITGFLNIFFGFSSSYILLIFFWGLNGWFQGFGWPPCARLLSYWYSEKSRGTWWSIWSTSHNVGGALIPLLVAFCLSQSGWRLSMFVPGIIAIVVGFWLIERLRDTPSSVGLYSAEEFEGQKPRAMAEKEKPNFKTLLFTYVLKNKYIWLLCWANFFVYIVRTAVNDWSMIYLSETKGFTLLEAGGVIPWFEAGGILGMIFAGWFSDKFLSGNRGLMAFVFMLFLLFPTSWFWVGGNLSYVVVSTLMFFIGLFLFGPQMLIGCAAVEKSHKDAAATASGFAGTFAYLGAACAGYPLGFLLESFGWNAFFLMLMVSTTLGGLCFLPFFLPRAMRRAIMQLRA